MEWAEYLIWDLDLKRKQDSGRKGDQGNLVLKQWPTTEGPFAHSTLHKQGLVTKPGPVTEETKLSGTQATGDSQLYKWLSHIHWTGQMAISVTYRTKNVLLIVADFSTILILAEQSVFCCCCFIVVVHLGVFF